MTDPTRVAIPVSAELLRTILRLPDTVTITGVGYDHARDTIDLLADVPDAPDGATTMIPTYQRSNGWPDPVHLCDIDWYDADGAPIAKGTGSYA